MKCVCAYSTHLQCSYDLINASGHGTIPGVCIYLNIPGGERLGYLHHSLVNPLSMFYLHPTLNYCTASIFISWPHVGCGARGVAGSLGFICMYLCDVARTVP